MSRELVCIVNCDIWEVLVIRGLGSRPDLFAVEIGQRRGGPFGIIAHLNNPKSVVRKHRDQMRESWPKTLVDQSAERIGMSSLLPKDAPITVALHQPLLGVVGGKEQSVGDRRYLLHQFPRFA